MLQLKPLLEDIHNENQMFVWSYNSARSCASISQSRGNCELASTPDAHANDTLIPTGNDLAAAKLEAE